MKPGTSFPWPALGAVTLWGASFVATRIALEGGFEPIALVVVRLLLGVVFLAGVARVRCLGLLPRREDRVRSFVLGLILAAHIGLQTTGLAYTSAIHTGWIVAFMPVAIAVAAQRFLGQRLTSLGWVGVSLGLSGVLVVIGSNPGDLAQARLGDAIQLATIPTWTAFTILAARVVVSSGALRVTVFSMAVAATALAPGLFVTGFAFEGISGRAWGALVFLGIACSGVAYAWWTLSQEKHGSQRTGAMLYFEPLVTVALAASILEEEITLEVVLGGVVVLMGVLLVARGEARRGRRPRDAEAKP